MTKGNSSTSYSLTFFDTPREIIAGVQPFFQNNPTINQGKDES